MKKQFVNLTLLITLLPIIALAHPGRTASDGCHYCRTNCDRWGESYGERHCHNAVSINSVRSNSSSNNDEDNTIWWILGIAGIVGFIIIKNK